MVPAVAVVDVDDAGAGVLRQDVAGQDAAEAELVAAVALLVGVAGREHLRPARVLQQLVGVVVEGLVVGGALAHRGALALVDLGQLGEQPPALGQHLVGAGHVAAERGEDSARIEIEAGGPRRQEAGAERSGARLGQVGADVGGEGVALATLRSQLVADDRAERGDLAGHRRVQRAAGLGVVLAVEVDELRRLERAHQRHLIHLADQLREERPRQVQALLHLGDVEILRRPVRLLEVPGVHLADGAAQLDEDAVAGGAARRRRALRAHVERPHQAVHPGAGQRHAAIFQGVATRRQQVGQSSVHDVLSG